MKKIIYREISICAMPISNYRIIIYNNFVDNYNVHRYGKYKDTLIFLIAHD